MKRQLLLIFVLFFWIAGITQAQVRELKGKVKDTETNEPLIGVSVLVKGTSTGTVTDADGNFAFTNLPQSDNISLIFAYVGFISQTIEVGNQTDINVSLQADKKLLDEIIVLGYGEVNKRDVTGAVVSVKTADLVKVPTTNVMESLQGKLPGVDITRSSGAAGAGINVTVRGNRSISANNNPLFIVDGIQYSNIQDLNPNDIESMEVLKDASTTAIYGSRGANGVIIITTKKAKAGVTKISFNSYVGVSQVKYPQLNNGADYVAQRVEANRKADGTLPAVNDIFKTAFEQQQIASNGSTDWPGLFTKNGMQQDYQLGISSGSEKTRFYLSFDYFKEDGVIRSDNLNRYTTRLNLDHSVTDWLKIGTQTQITYYDINRRSNPLTNAAKINPLYSPNDATTGQPTFLIEGKFVNPLFDELPDHYVNNEKTTRLFASVYFDVKFSPSLSLRTNVGVILGNGRTGIYRASESVDRAGSASQASIETAKNLNFTWENILTYKKTFGEHNLTATAVTTLLKNNNEGAYATGYNQLLNSQLFYGLGNAPDQISIASAYEKSALVSFTGRVNYSYKGKYIFSVTARTDGASQLVKDKKWSLFTAASLAWQIIDEEFMKNQNIFTALKLRASYGLAGNSAVSPYSSASLLTRIPYSFDEVSATGNRFSTRIGNPNLGWELSTTYNIGLDFGIWKNRITGSIDVYDTRTKDLLLPRSLPPTSGASTAVENIGKTRNRGVEIGLNGTIIDKADLRWNVGINWFTNKEEITELATGSNDLVNGWFIGQPTTAFYDYEKLGIWQTSEADQATTFGQKPGDIKVKDQNGDGKITPDDRVIVGTPRPKWNANLSTDITYKGFDLGIQFFARMGQTMSYEYASLFDPQGVENSVKYNYWTVDNPSNEYPRPNAALSKSSMLYFTTLQYKDASFIKLRGVTLGYSLPKAWIEKVKLSRARVYVTGRNIFTITDVKNYDPERGGSISNPIPRLWVAGLNLEF